MGGFPRLSKKQEKPNFYGLGPLAPPQPKAVKHAKILIDDAVEYHNEGSKELAVKVLNLAIEQLELYQEQLEGTKEETCRHAFKYNPGADAKICDLCGKIKPLSHG